MEDLVKTVVRMAAEEQLWQPGDAVIVAISGGPDSTALLHLLHRISQDERLSLVAAHVNHGFRPEESAREAEAVRLLCGRLGIRCEIAELDVPAYKEKSRLNAQLAARTLRYAFLEETAAKYGACRIALGHHADDQAETLLMRFIRGTGPGGLAGMKMKRKQKNVELIRPLLRINKTNLIDYCHQHRLPYSSDSSNAERYYFRNVVRLDIIPFLETFNPQLSGALGRLADLTGAEDAFLEQQTAELYKRLVSKVPGGMFMPREALLEQHAALQRRLIKLILNYLAPKLETSTYDLIETVRQAALNRSPSTWSADLGEGIRFIREYDTLKWLSVDSAIASGPESGFEYAVDRDTKQVSISESGVWFLLDKADRAEIDLLQGPASRYEAWFELSELRYPLTIRNRRPGDRMAVLGLKGTKKVQDMFVDHKVPPSLRERVPIVCDSEGRLLWIPGVRRSAFASVRAEDGAILRIRMFQADPETE